MATPAPSSDHDAHHHELRADDYAGLLHEQNHRMAALAHSLTPEQWIAPSLCDGWRACDVLGHITYGNTTPLPKVMALIVFRYRGDVNRGLGRGVQGPGRRARPGRACSSGFDAGDGPAGRARQGHQAIPTPMPTTWSTSCDIRRPSTCRARSTPSMLMGALDALMTVKSRFFAPAKVADGLRFQAPTWRGPTGRTARRWSRGRPRT